MPELPNIVSERLKASRPINAHPDPDVLTAFAERSLPEAERAVILEHLARCHDCRDILSLALPATVTVETARVPLPARKGGFVGGFIGWFGTPALRWGVVAAGFAVLALAGILQYQRWQQETFLAARQTQAPAAQTTTAQVSREKESPKPTASAPAAAAVSADAAPAGASRVDPLLANARNAKSNFTTERTAAAGPVRGAVSPSASSTPKTPQLTAALPAPASAYGGAVAAPLKQNSQVPSRAAANANAPVTVEAQTQLQAMSEQVEVTTQPAQLEAKNQQKDRPAAGPDQHSAIDATVDKAKAPSTTVEVSNGLVLETESAPSALLASLWSISATGGLLHSFDQGRSWANVDVNANQSTGANLVAVQAAPEYKKYDQTAQDMTQQQVQNQAQSKTLSKSSAPGRQKAAAAAAAAAATTPMFRAVSANGLEIWAGGSASVLYHSSDGGQQWTRVLPSASGVSLTGDIVGIAFPDPQHGKLETSTFELWTTADAGQTWHKP
jgi:hypothetical protein